MAWTSPTTRITGELITAVIWNGDIVDDLLFLHQRVVLHLQGWNHTTDATIEGIGAWISPRSNDSQSQDTYFSMAIPSDFSSLTSLKVLLHPEDIATYNYDVEVSYAAEGEGANTHNATSTSQTFTTTVADEITLVDLSALVGSLSADDFLAVKWSGNSGGIANAQRPNSVILEYNRT